MLARQIDVLYRSYLEKQVDTALLKRITSKANEIEQAFNVYRAKLNGRAITDSEVRQILKQSKDSRERQAVWISSKGVGAVVEQDLRQLVEYRDQAAQKLGFKNFHAMKLYQAEQDPAQVLELFDQLDALTREPFAEAKAEIDIKLAQHCGITVDQLQPWHYHDPFFQDAPAIADVNLDKALANIVPNEYWMGTMLHELGHAVYSSKNIPSTIPYTLRTDAHILCTEGVAMMFERFSKSGEWLRAMGVSIADPAAYSRAGAEMRRNQLLIFSHWCQVMLRFEQQMYANPGQNLNDLWWNLVEEYQLVRRPAGRNTPDYGAKIHVVSAPCYYHNYMMGELFACQVHATIARDVLGADDIPNAYYTDNKKVGQFMKTRVFEPGATLGWNELTKHATGQELKAQAFAAEFGEN